MPGLFSTAFVRFAVHASANAFDRHVQLAHRRTSWFVTFADSFVFWHGFRGFKSSYWLFVVRGWVFAIGLRCWSAQAQRRISLWSIYNSEKLRISFFCSKTGRSCIIPPTMKRADTIRVDPQVCYDWRKSSKRCIRSCLLVASEWFPLLASL